MNAPIVVPPILVKVTTSRGPLQYQLQAGGITVGSAGDNRIVLQEDGISAHHARVDWDPEIEVPGTGLRGSVTLTDVGGNTFIGGERLLPSHPTTWAIGKTARIGSYALVYEWIGIERSGIGVSAADLVITPGATLEWHVIITNLTEQIDTVTLFLESDPSIPEQWILGAGAPFVLNQNQKVDRALRVVVPKDSTATAGPRVVTIHAGSTANPEKPGQTQANWDINPFDKLHMQVEPDRAPGVKRASYWTVLGNEGNRPLTYDLTVKGEGTEVVPAYHVPPRVTIRNGEEKKERITVQAARLHWFGAPRLHKLRVKSTPESYGEYQEREVVYPQQPVFSIGRLIAIGLVLAVACLVAWFVWWKEPDITAADIVQFQPSALTVTKGDDVTVSWKVLHAKDVTITPFGTVPLEGVEVVHPLPATTTFELTAVDWKGNRATKRFTVTVEPFHPPQPTLTASPLKIKSDHEITLQWTATGAARVALVCENVPMTLSLTPAEHGTQNLLVRGDGTLRFHLKATAEDGSSIDSEPVQVEVTCKCPPPWRKLRIEPR